MKQYEITAKITADVLESIVGDLVGRQQDEINQLKKDKSNLQRIKDRLEGENKELNKSLVNLFKAHKELKVKTEHERGK